jgi:hypothetical protein
MFRLRRERPAVPARGGLQEALARCCGEVNATYVRILVAPASLVCPSQAPWRAPCS